ncbi:MAG: outer membrane lipoprotein chaperone LolA [Burkholderiales bacterium]|jgi:outer membrane lipoprotein carrier protein|nr:outer membrane lipoprotein chaperone LolA [Burkholderiales bacterium]
MKALLWLVALGAFAHPAHAGAVEQLEEFVRDVKTGQAAFTQTVTSPDGARTKTSSGRFEFSRPNRFRFAYTKPFEQAIVADGSKVWIFDADLNQVSSRRLSSALGGTPAALLAGGSLTKDFVLAPQPDKDGLSWVLATARGTEPAQAGAAQRLPQGPHKGPVVAPGVEQASDGRALPTESAFQSVRVGFRGKVLAAVEIVDSFGQRSSLQFSQFEANPVLKADAFVFKAPPGADVIEQ